MTDRPDVSTLNLQPDYAEPLDASDKIMPWQRPPAVTAILEAFIEDPYVEQYL